MKRTLITLFALALATTSYAQRAITVRGSDTMVIMNARLAERFMEKNPGTTIQVTGGGSGVGVAALINGTTEIAASSRPIRTSEVDKLKARFATRGVGIPVARDGLAIYLNTANTLAELSLQQIADIYMGKVTNWKQLGGKDAPIVIYSRENSSGTYVYFKDNVLKGRDFSPRAQTLQGTAAVVNAVSKDPNGIGYGGAAYARGVKFAKVKKDAKSPGFLPSLMTVRSGDYPISRQLFFYLRGNPAGNTKKWIDWILTPEGQDLVTKVGYFPVK